jgi:hypothetical protein
MAVEPLMNELMNTNFFLEPRQIFFADYVLHAYRHNGKPNVEFGIYPFL